MPKKSATRRVSKSEWLDAALLALAEGGIEAVRIERLAKSLRTSRSGFYWHFRERVDLHRDMLRHWQYEFTDVVVQNAEAVGGSPQDRLLAVAEMVDEHNLARFDLAIRSWAQNDSLARKAYIKATNTRLDYIRSLFAELGFDGQDLEMRSMLYVCYQTWESAMFLNIPKSKLADVRGLRLKLLTGK